MVHRTFSAWAVFFVCLLAAGRGQADSLAFDYKDPKDISAVSLKIDSKLEPIVGYAKGISGTVLFDPANPKATTGKIAVDVASVQFANEGYTQTARVYALKGEKYPQIFFTLRKVLNVTKTTANVYKALVLADFTCRGVTTPLRTTVTATYFPGRAQERTGDDKGDLLILRTDFNVSRTRQGISKGIPGDMVSDTIQIGVAVVGTHYPPGQKKPKAADALKTISDDKAPASPETKTSPKSKTKSPPKTTRVWKMEVEQRDDPTHVEAALTLDANAPQAVFKTAAGTLNADRVKFDGSRLTFHLPDNPQADEQEGEAVIEGDTLRGRLKGKTEILKFHARLKRAGDDLIKYAPADTVQGPGFRDLKIETKGVTSTLLERMKFHHVPAVSLARIENFRVVETGTFGVTDVETGELADENTLFQAGGMGSPLVNILALKLAAQGRLDLSRAANAYLKSAQIPDNAFTKTRKVKVLDLVNGTSGLSQYKFTGYRPGLKIPTLAELLNGADRDEMEPLTVMAPGTFGGAGINGAVLEQVIVDATGRRLPDLMQELIFTPFEMTHSTYEPMPQAAASRKVAIGHYSTGERMLDKIHIYPQTGETGLWTTAGDFAKMLCQVQLLLAGKPNEILNAAQGGLLKSVTTERQVLGLIKSQKDPLFPASYFYHGGDPYGYFANHATAQQNGCGVVVMENRIMAWQLNNEIIQAAARQHPWEGSTNSRQPMYGNREFRNDANGGTKSGSSNGRTARPRLDSTVCGRTFGGRIRRAGAALRGTDLRDLPARNRGQEPGGRRVAGRVPVVEPESERAETL